MDRQNPAPTALSKRCLQRDPACPASSMPWPHKKIVDERIRSAKLHTQPKRNHHIAYRLFAVQFLIAERSLVRHASRPGVAVAVGRPFL